MLSAQHCSQGTQVSISAKAETFECLHKEYTGKEFLSYIWLLCLLAFASQQSFLCLLPALKTCLQAPTSLKECVYFVILVYGVGVFVSRQFLMRHLFTWSYCSHCICVLHIFWLMPQDPFLIQLWFPASSLCKSSQCCLCIHGIHECTIQLLKGIL